MKAVLLNRILLVLAFVGLFVAGTLSLPHILGVEIPCGPGGSCADLAKDPSAKWFNIPVAFFGVAGYLLLAGIAAARSFLSANEGPSVASVDAPVGEAGVADLSAGAAAGALTASGSGAKYRMLVNLGYAVSAVGALVSIFLQFQSLVVLHKRCDWCIASAIIMILMFILHAMLSQSLDDTRDMAAPASKSDFPLFAALPVLLALSLGVMAFSLEKSANPSLSKNSGASVEFVPKDAHVFGQEDSPITIVEFADMYCPACQKMSPLVKDYVAQNPGKMRLVYRHFPLEQLHPMAMTGAAVSEAVADEGKFWQFLGQIMGKQAAHTSPDEVLEVARSVGVDPDKIRKRLENTEDPLYERVARDLQAVKDLGINSTPTFVILHKGNILDVTGPSKILDRLQAEDVQKILNGGNG